MPTQRCSILIAAALISTTLSVAVTAPQRDSRPNVVLITIDTLRVDYVSCYPGSRVATPTLEGLAADGTVFERAYSQVPMTPPSHASILTGTYPATHGLRDFTSTGLPAGFPTLAGILKKSGYSTAAFVSAYVLDSVWGMNQGFDVYYDHFTPKDILGVNPGNVQRKAGETVDHAIAWLNGGAHTPYFLWVHLYDPHHDYNPPEPFHTKYAKDLYGGEVAYTDHELGRLFQDLKRRGEYEDSVIVMVSDHGESFGEHEEYEHGFFIYESTTHIPFIVKPPRVAGTPARRVKRIVETVDIAPTILQITHAEEDRKRPMQGRGLLGEILGKRGASRPAAYSETLYPLKNFGWSDLASYTEDRLKYIEAPTPELYDLAADPGEKINLYSKQRALADSLREKLRQFRHRFADAGENSASSMDPQRTEALRSLGYVAVTVPLRKQAGRDTLIDPKDRIQIFNRILFSMQASDAGKLARSDSMLSEVIRLDPDLFIAHFLLGVNGLKSGDNEKALESFNKARALNPSFDLTDMNRANALARMGRVDEAISIFLDILKRTPSRLDAKKQLGQLYSRKKKYQKAVEIYRSILSEHPADGQVTKFLGIALVDSEQYQQGVESLNQAIVLGANDALAQNFLGIALSNLGRVEDAVAAYRKALELKQDYEQARLNLSFALLKSGLGKEAKQQFALLCKQNVRMCETYQKYFVAPE